MSAIVPITFVLLTCQFHPVTLVATGYFFWPRGEADSQRTRNKLMERVWVAVKVVVAGLAALWLGMPGAFKALMLMQLIDIATGMAAATQATEPDKRLSSSIATHGMRRKGLDWAVVGVVYVLETYLATEMKVSVAGFTPAAATAAYFAVKEGLSILENAARAGVPIPDFVTNALAQQRRTFGGGQ